MLQYVLGGSEMKKNITERILLTATSLFAEIGFTNVTIKQLAHAANINPAAISYYFGGKETLYQEVLRYQFSPAIQALYSGTLVKTKIDKFLNVSGSRHCSIEQQCREVALCWRDVPDG